ncbi:MAG TPA: PEP-utilizing enzyme [Polyangia bacterium]|nr:PEP-utilizing enzyme [Polyangia bacterium]
MPLSLCPLDAAAPVAAAGHKACTLARARAAGLPVPDGVVVLPGVTYDVAALQEIVARWGVERYVVRSSANVEDRRDASAAGVFESVLGVRAEELPAAIERVRGAATRETARLYLAARGLGEAEMATLVQPEVKARRLGVLHVPDLEAVGGLLAEEREPGEPEWGAVAPRRVEGDDPLARGARRMAALVGAPAVIEYALTEEGPTFLQARPLPAEPAAAVEPLESSAWIEPWDLGDEASWRCDLEHNPEPLSEAQAALVRLLADLPAVPRQRVRNGYLFYSYDGVAPARAAPPHQLPRLYGEEIAPACEAVLAPLEERAARPVATDLEAALAAYRVVAQRCFGEIGPALGRARQMLDQFLRANLGEGLIAHGELLGGAGGISVARDQLLWELAEEAARGASALGPMLEEYRRRFGACSPAWDVATPTDEEDEARVRASAGLVHRGRAPAELHAAAVQAAEAAAEALLERLDRMARRAFKALLPVVRATLPIAEEDDLLFFRAQRVVRRPLLALGRAASAAGTLERPELVFDLPIEEVLAARLDGAAAHAAHALRQRRRRLRPPRSVVGGVSRAATGSAAAVLRGAGVPGWARGRVLRIGEGAMTERIGTGAVPVGAVLVVPAILPSLTFLLPACAALVTDHGGALSHGALLAREYGIPAVLGTGRATALLRDGEEVVVDGDAGRVLRLGEVG